MTKTRFLTLLGLLALLAAVPMASALAQQQIPQKFYGAVTMQADGSTPAEGTAVTAMINGEQVGSGMVDPNGMYLVLVEGDYADQEVTFMIGDEDANESATFVNGDITPLHLSVGQAPAPKPTLNIAQLLGPKGDKGDKGDPGEPGPAGEQGPPGEQGPAGTDGNDGAAGPAGPAGADGNDGSDGARGASGTNGEAGPAGPAGAAGPAGPAGADGGGGGLAIVALIIAIVGVVAAGGAFIAGRNSS